mmetsp:Transcript_2047/g.5121  ORF Transcript_2047/g.5121 Transcript_2047/m.5121 type:complete len:317 (+) Transcript_2047:902-1852(+)
MHQQQHQQHHQHHQQHHQQHQEQHHQQHQHWQHWHEVGQQWWQQEQEQQQQEQQQQQHHHHHHQSQPWWAAFPALAGVLPMLSSGLLSGEALASMLMHGAPAILGHLQGHEAEVDSFWAGKKELVMPLIHDMCERMEPFPQLQEARTSFDELARTDSTEGFAAAFSLLLRTLTSLPSDQQQDIASVVFGGIAEKLAIVATELIQSGGANQQPWGKGWGKGGKGLGKAWAKGMRNLWAKGMGKGEGMEGDSSATVPAEASAHVPAEQVPLDQQASVKNPLEVLAEMGFVDMELNAQLLVAHNNNVDAVVQALLIDGP